MLFQSIAAVNNKKPLVPIILVSVNILAMCTNKTQCNVTCLYQQAQPTQKSHQHPTANNQQRCVSTLVLRHVSQCLATGTITNDDDDDDYYKHQGYCDRICSYLCSG